MYRKGLTEKAPVLGEYSLPQNPTLNLDYEDPYVSLSPRPLAETAELHLPTGAGN